MIRTTSSEARSPGRARVTLLAALLLVAACGRGEVSEEARSDSSAVGTGASQGEPHEEEEPRAGPLAGRVTLTEAAHGNAGIEVAEARMERIVAGGAAIEAPGRVAFDPARVALISPRAAGRIERLEVVEGVSVRAGQPVAYLLSPAFITAQNDFIQATQRAERLRGTHDEVGARALEAAARRRLQLLGASDTLLANLNPTGMPLDLLPIFAPFDGSIIERHAMTGAAVEPGSPLYTIADLSHVDVIANVPERALEGLTVGQSAAVRVPAFASLQLEGRVKRIREVLDTTTRTVEAVIGVRNQRRRLRPGMFATVSLRSASGALEVPVLTVPASAVLVDGSDRIVFVQVAERTYERRVVDALPLRASDERAPALAIVREGLAQGDRIVVRGAFFLKSELAKASFGEHHD
jgi:RND family efflux transporter MFP subunit